ncbi:MAG: tRNA (N6-threonylcarbamoyladenosine(37)-N6)-methyltransferase TrmO [Chlorobi bacterium]|nr:tRNA (N6-threonylcarbamoyladenosine(37)-N6)-methyltransferase TrmO [Chlorobiota bacterium]
MNENKIVFKVIGHIQSPHIDPKQTPIQPVFCKGIKGKAIIEKQYIDGLNDLEGFSHIYLFYSFHESNKTNLILKPYLEDKLHGVFATRAPHRPNKLGMSLVRLIKVEGNILFIGDVDILNNTPLLDIKPFIKRFDTRQNARSGWQEDVTDDEASLRGKRDY